MIFTAAQLSALPVLDTCDVLIARGGEAQLACSGDTAARVDDEVMRLVEKMNESSRLMEKEMRDREAARNKEYEERIDELKRQKDDVEADNIRLSRIIAALKGESRVVGVMRRIRRHAGVRPNGAGRERTGVEGGAGAAERGDQRAALRAGGGAEERGRRDGEAEGGDEPRGEGEAGAEGGARPRGEGEAGAEGGDEPRGEGEGRAARREGLRAEGERGAASAERAAAERQGPTGEGARGAASAERAAAGEAEDAGGHDERDD